MWSAAAMSAAPTTAASESTSTSGVEGAPIKSVTDPLSIEGYGMERITEQLLGQLRTAHPKSPLATARAPTASATYHPDSGTEEVSDDNDADDVTIDADADADVTTVRVKMSTGDGKAEATDGDKASRKSKSKGKDVDGGSGGGGRGGRRGKRATKASTERKQRQHALAKHMRSFIMGLPSTAHFNLNARYDSRANVRQRVVQLQLLTKQPVALQVLRDGVLVDHATSAVALAVHGSGGGGGAAGGHTTAAGGGGGAGGKASASRRQLASLVKALEHDFTTRVKELQHLVYRTLPTSHQSTSSASPLPLALHHSLGWCARA